MDAIRETVGHACCQLCGCFCFPCIFAYWLYLGAPRCLTTVSQKPVRLDPEQERARERAEQREQQEREREREWNEQRLKDTPSPLPAFRIRDLSPRPCRPGVETPHPQSQLKSCYLLFKLPLELRIMIWDVVLADKTLHIARFPQRKLGYVLCPEDFLHDWPQNSYREGDGCTSRWDLTSDWGSGSKNTWHPLTHWGKVNSYGYTLSGTAQPLQLLSLLQTCRQVYTEAITVLYSNNTFSFAEPEVLVYFTRSILPSRHQLLRSLRLQVRLPLPTDNVMLYRGFDDPTPDPYLPLSMHRGSAWEEACLVLARDLTGLTELRILILAGGVFGKSFMYDVSSGMYMLEPLRKVKVQERGGKFVVDVPWRPGNRVEQECVEKGGPWPFEIVREHVDWKRLCNFD